MRRHLYLWLVASSVAAVSAQQTAPVFHSATLLVPIDVRVLDDNGKPITDLTADNFTILEDGTPQSIGHFSTQALQPGALDVRAALAPRAPLSPEVAPQSRRVFLIVLGRGRLQGPSKGVDALLRLVRERLLPQDDIAVLAWDRATDFTTDHERIARMIERFGRAHEGIEHAIKDRFSGPAAIYGSRELPASIQRDIDAVFADPGTASVREVPAAEITSADRINADAHATANVIDRATRPGSLGRNNVASIGASFDDFVATNRQSMQDVGNIYTGIEYLRRLEGEKHLIFVTEQGVSLPRLEDDRSLAATACDARVVIDTIQTGGLPDAPPPPEELSDLAPPPGPSLKQTLAISTLRDVSELTGGLSSLFSPAFDAIDAINSATRFSYLLGYYPSNTTWDGHYRRIIVKVNRPGTTVLYRHGYNAVAQLTPFDRRRMVIASRLGAAANVRQDIHDLELHATAKRNPADPSDVIVDVSIDAARVSLQDLQNQRVGTISLGLVGRDSHQALVGQLTRTVELKMDDVMYQHAMKDGIQTSSHLPVTGDARTVKVIVYDYAADLVGTVVVTVK